MSEDFGSDYIVIEDEDGNEIELEHMDTVEFEDREYMAFIPAHADEDAEEVDFIILRVEDDEEEGLLVTVDDEAELERVYEVFMKRLEELDSEDE